MPESRPYDIVLFGATGFAGRLTAAHLATHAPPGLRWALAGRDPDRLARVRDELAAVEPGAADVPLLTADIGEPATLRELAGSTQVLATTVGPYALYGHALVAACADLGTDYLDLTGEPEFVDVTYVRHHRRAQETGARLVHAAGFDSIPHDLGVYFTVRQLPADVALQVRGYVRASASFSGGTFASILTGVSRPAQNLRAARAARTARAGEPRTDERRVHIGLGRPHRDPVQDGWAVPLPTLDPQIVGRSARALERYGPDFAYEHYASVPHLHTIAAAGAGLGALAVLAQVPPAREFLSQRLKPGDGPSADRRARSWFSVHFLGTGGGQRVITRVSGGDPGYDETARMLAESALCLATDDLPPTAGQVSTAVAMGDALLDRLRKVGVGFDVLAD